MNTAKFNEAMRILFIKSNEARIYASAFAAIGNDKFSAALILLADDLDRAKCLANEGFNEGSDAVPPVVPPAVLVEAKKEAAPVELNCSGTLDNLVDGILRKTLSECGGNVSCAAEKLGISRKTFYNRLPDLRQETHG